MHTQRETARLIREVKGGHYLMIVKANQPALLDQLITALAGTDEDFADTTWVQEGKGHGRREKRVIRTAPADGIDWPHAAQVMRIRRDSGRARGSWEHKEIAYDITSLPAALAGPRHLACYARHHWAIENREHYVRDKTFSEDLQQSAPGTSPAPMPPSATWSSAAYAARRVRQHRPRPPLPTAATTSTSSPSTDTPERTSKTRGHITQTRRGRGWRSRAV